MNKKFNSHSKNTKRDSKLESLLHSRHIVNIEKMAVGGHGIARLQIDNQHLVVFVPQSAPGDELEAEIVQVEKNFLIAKINKIIKPSKARVKPECSVADICGGCPWQHIDDSEQVHQKEQILKDLLKKFVPQLNYSLAPTITGKNRYNYRNRIQLKHLGSQVGYFKPETHDIVDINDCPIAEAPLRDWLKTEKPKLKSTERLRKYELKINQADQVEFYPIGQRSEGLSFSQVNREINKHLVDKVVDLVQKAKPTKMTELYAGSGNFTFSIAAVMDELLIDAVELNPDLTSQAVEKIKTDKLQKRIRFFTTASEIFPRSNTLSRELVFIDPPRSGCEKSLVLHLATVKPQTLIYVSCHPVSLVRDLQLMQQHGAQIHIDYLQIFDMFPQTDHFETLCVLRLA